MVLGGFFDEPKRARPRFTQKEKELHYKAQNGKCNGCKKKFDIRNLAVDHIRAFAKGGGERGHNLQLLCTACNSAKGKGTQAQLKKKLAQQGIIKTTPKAKLVKPSKPPAKRGTTPFDPLPDLFSF